MTTEENQIADRLEPILALARLTLHGALPELERRLIVYFTDLLGSDSPSSMRKPEAVGGKVWIADHTVGPWDPDDAIAYAVQLIKAAERARAAG